MIRKGNKFCPHCKKPLPNFKGGQTFCSVACFNLHNGKSSVAALNIRDGDKFD